MRDLFGGTIRGSMGGFGTEGFPTEAWGRQLGNETGHPGDEGSELPMRRVDGAPDCGCFHPGSLA